MYQQWSYITFALNHWSNILSENYGNYSIGIKSDTKTSPIKLKCILFERIKLYWANL